MIVCPLAMGRVSVSSTVEPEMATAVTAFSLPSVVTTKADAAGVVEEVPPTQSLASS